MKLVLRTEPTLVHNVVMKFMEGYHGKRHCIVTDNFFTSIGLFEEFMASKTYVSRLVQFQLVEIL
jgi:hypothetical protein